LGGHAGWRRATPHVLSRDGLDDSRDAEVAGRQWRSQEFVVRYAKYIKKSKLIRNIMKN